MSEIQARPTVSIVIPCRNEENFIGKCLDSIVASDYPHEKLEVIVVDAMSVDGTRDILDEYRNRYGFIQVIDNPRRITPVAFNLGIKHSSGALILIMSAHSTYAPDAIRKCTEYSHQYQADNVGGVWVTHPRRPTLMARAVVQAMSHRFGVGARYRTSGLSKPCWADTAAFGCYRREVFDRIGFYNEKLVRSQDMELNLRLKNAGGRTLLAPDVIINYSARTDLVPFCRHNFLNGEWAIMPFAHSEVMPVSWRHLVPLAFVLALAATALLGLLAQPFLWIFCAIVALYFCASFAAAVQIAWKNRNPLYALLVPPIFALLHIGYGLGSLSGVLKILSSEHRTKLFSLPLRYKARVPFAPINQPLARPAHAESPQRTTAP